jgi:hypothetical protein
VHGIGGLRATDVEHRAWSVALAQGARQAGHADAVSGLTQSWLADVRFANYSDLYHSAGTQGDGDEELGAEEIGILAELLDEMMDELAHQAKQRDDVRSMRVVDDAREELADALRPDTQSQGLGEPVRLLGCAATTLMQLPGLRRAGQWASGASFVGHLAQVGRYLARTNADGVGIPIDARIRARVLDGLDPSRPLVVISHSLGTVVAYEALHLYSGPVTLWVTLGSPLATGGVVLNRLLPTPARTPERVKRWLNFWDRDDVVVGRPRVEKWMRPSTHGVLPVTDRVDSDGLWVHTATKYLAQGKVAGPVVEALKQ